MTAASRPILIGYARVSTEEQANDAQLLELRAAGCGTIFEEHGSGASRARPVLARLLREINRGDVLVVVRLDRLARSVSHLLTVIEQLEERVRISGRCMTPLIPRRRKACFPCRFSARWPSWNAP